LRAYPKNGSAFGGGQFSIWLCRNFAYPGGGQFGGQIAPVERGGQNGGQNLSLEIK